jgi:hypothetical protein
MVSWWSRRARLSVSPGRTDVRILERVGAPATTATLRRLERAGSTGKLEQLAERVRPAGFGRPRVVAAVPAITDLLPDGGLRRGSTVVVEAGAGAGTGPAGTSLVAALVAGASAAGSWCAVVGLPELGLAAVAEMGADLSRVALVPAPGRALTSVIGALLDAVDLVLVAPRGQLRAGDARRLAARARERSTVLVAFGETSWPVAADLRLATVRAEWQGLGDGWGRLRSRLVELEVSGRGTAARAQRGTIWLPSPDGTVQPAGAARPGPAAGAGTAAAVAGAARLAPAARPAPAAAGEPRPVMAIAGCG